MGSTEKLKPLLVASPTGSMHAIKPKTNKTHCGRAVPDYWQKIANNQEITEPSCTICKRHYDDPVKEELLKVKEDLMESIDNLLTVQVWIKDSDGVLGRFTKTVAQFVKEETELAKQKHPEAAKLAEQ
jgi:hypothetical protein